MVAFPRRRYEIVVTTRRRSCGSQASLAGTISTHARAFDPPTCLGSAVMWRCLDVPRTRTRNDLFRTCCGRGGHCRSRRAFPPVREFPCAGCAQRTIGDENLVVAALGAGPSVDVLHRAPHGRRTRARRTCHAGSAVARSRHHRCSSRQGEVRRSTAPRTKRTRRIGTQTSWQRSHQRYVHRACVERLQRMTRRRAAAGSAHSACARAPRGAARVRPASRSSSPAVGCRSV